MLLAYTIDISAVVVIVVNTIILTAYFVLNMLLTWFEFHQIMGGVSSGTVRQWTAWVRYNGVGWPLDGSGRPHEPHTCSAAHWAQPLPYLAPTPRAPVMSASVRTTLQTVPEALPADHVTKSKVGNMCSVQLSIKISVVQSQFFRKKEYCHVICLVQRYYCSCTWLSFVSGM